MSSTDTTMLRCCNAQQQYNQPYIGVQQKCHQYAIFCLLHNPHKSTQGLMHQMLPLKHFKKTLQQKKFKMNEKIGIMIDQYNNLMDSLLEQIRELKLKKNIQFSMLWLRQLAKDEQEYELMRQIYRMDFKNLTCSMIHSIYFKIVHNQILERKSVQQIDCYKGICNILQHLNQQKQTRSFLSKKIAQIEGILQNGEILKRSLPDKIVFKQNIKEVLLESFHQGFIDIKYNKCKIVKSSRQYLSIFSKYPLVPHLMYHLTLNTKYTNVMLGVCTSKLISGLSNFKHQGLNIQQSQISLNQSFPSETSEFDNHYSKQSVVYNFSNGCIYKQGMFESGGNTYHTKDKKQLIIKLRCTQNQLIIMYGKNVLARQNIDHLTGDNGKIELNLHILLRQQGDSFQVDRDKQISSDGLLSQVVSSNQPQQHSKPVVQQRPLLDLQQLKRRNQQEGLLMANMQKQIMEAKQKNAINLNQDSSSLPYILPDTISDQKIQIQNKRPKGNALLLLNDRQKQQKINQLIKRQRLDKILNDIKTKPKFSEQPVQPGNRDIKKRIRQIQQKKVSKQIKQTPRWRQKMEQLQINQLTEINTSNVEDSRMPTSPDNSDTVELDKFLKRLKPQNTSIDYIHSGVMKSGELNPLLMIKKQNHHLNPSTQFLNYPSAASGFADSSAMLSPVLKVKSSHKSQYSQIKTSQLQQHQQQGVQIVPNILGNNRKNKLLKPYQKSFKLCQDESFNFDDMASTYKGETNHSMGRGNETPMDRVGQFQFGKKSLNFPKSHQSNLGRNMLNLQTGLKKSYQLASNKIKVEEENSLMQKSMNLMDAKRSQVIESYDIGDFDHQKINVRMMAPTGRIPTLKQTHFSKFPSELISNADESYDLGNKVPGIINIQSPKSKMSGNDQFGNINLSQSQIEINSSIGQNEKSLVKNGNRVDKMDFQRMFLGFNKI